MKKRVIFGVIAAVVVFSGIMFGTQAMETVLAAETVSISGGNSVNGLSGSLTQKILTTYKQNVYKEAGCTVILPAGYLPSKEVEGLYLSERNPLDSSNIYYTVTDAVDKDTLRKSLSDGAYGDLMEKGFIETYGSDAKVVDFSYKDIQVDGCPAFEISFQCAVGDMVMEQLILMITADRTYMVTYSQSSDDDRMEEFRKSAESVSMVFK